MGEEFVALPGLKATADAASVPSANAPALGDRWITGFPRRVRRWLERCEAALVDERCGGNQRCPWCRQGVNHFKATSITATPDGFTDAITCGNCGGSSLWKWEIGFFYICRLVPPPEPPNAYGDSKFIARVSRDARKWAVSQANGTAAAEPVDLKPGSAT